MSAQMTADGWYIFTAHTQEATDAHCIILWTDAGEDKMTLY